MANETDGETVPQMAETIVDPSREEDTVTRDPEVEIATDEVGVPLEETGYPPLPPHEPKQSRSVPRHRGQPSRRSSQQQKIETPQLSEETIDYDTPKSLAMKNQNMKAKDYLSLVKTLTSGLTSDRQKVMSFSAWISRQEIETRKDLKGNPDTPLGYMKLMQEGRGTYSAFLASVCRKAGIPCVIVKGYGKTSNIKPGEQSDEELKKLTSSWNLVFVDGNWKIVHLFMVCHGKDNFGIPPENDIILQRVFHDNYIFPDGEIFSTRYIPDEQQSKWQLGVKYSFEEWKMAPCLYPSFQSFGFGFIKPSDKTSVITTENGLIQIYFLFAEDNLTNIEISFNLGDLDEMKSNTDLNEYVYMTIETEPSQRLGFEVRFPQTGSYVFKIFVAEKLRKAKIIVSYRLDCLKLMEATRPYKLPVTSGPSGWGYGPKALEHGLYMPSHRNGKLTIKKSESLNMQFLMLQELDVTLRMCHASLSEAELSKFLLHKLKADKESRRRELSISVQIPIEGEFALQIGISKDGKDFPICNYLLCVVTKSKLETGSKRQTPQERAAIQGLREVLGSNDINELQSSLEYAKKHHISMEDEDLKRVIIRIHLLEQKKELHDALLRNRIDVGTSVLSKMEYSEFKDVLTPEMEEVRDMINTLKLRKGKHVTEDEECNIISLAEICNMKSPPDEILSVMRAVCLLIGHRKNGLDYWEDVRVKLMIDKRKTLAKMRKTTQELSEGISRSDAESTRGISYLLSSLTPRRISSVGQTLVPYYKWVKETVDKLTALGMDEEKSRNPQEIQDSLQKQ